MKLLHFYMVHRTHVALRVPTPEARLGAGKHSLAALHWTHLVQLSRVFCAGAGGQHMHFHAVNGANVEFLARVR